MMRIWLIGVSAVVATTPASADDAEIAAGQAFVAANCAECHAVGPTGDSTHPEAPPFRTLSERYPIEALGEALAEGIVVGHPDMPEFTLAPDDVAAVIAYLESIQE